MPPSEDDPKLSLESIQAPPGTVSDKPDQNTAREVGALVHHARALRELDLAERKQVLNQRKSYAKGAFGLVCLWLTCILAISILQGLGAGGATFYFVRWWPIRFQLDSTVMIALIATTTANIIAVLVIVMKYFFPSHESNEKVAGEK